ncbi:MAG: glycoside hydrolase 43 family protein [Treponema sp.]|nr:glycoside hydrolase 43 family protein [Treponema sp.]
MNYKNPILLCDYSDPDVCRVENDFYLTASSFNFVPGLPVLHSKDLVNWTLINYACKSINLPGYEKVQNAKGIWAPSIRHHEGKFYIFFATPDEGIFYTCASDPKGEWSPLSCLWSGKGFEDPCPFWEKDQNGKEHLYIVHAYVRSRIGFNSKLGLLEADPLTFKAISEDKIIFDGTITQPTIEGPKVYTRNGYYYIFAPAGSVTRGWQTVLRSKHLDGDYEEKIVLIQGLSKVNGPHQGGWVTTPSGQDWFIHFQDAGIYGRITHLEPMRWVNDWPVMGTSVKLKDDKALAEIGQPVSRWAYPDIEGAPFTDEKNLLSEFQNSGNPGSENFASTKKPLWECPSVSTKKIDSSKFTWEKEIPLTGDWHENERRGIIFLGNEYNALQIEKTGLEEFTISYIESSGSESGDDVRSEKTLWSEKFSPLSEKIKSGTDMGKITLKMDFKVDRDGKTGIIVLSVKRGGLKFKSKPFKTVNAHWVGGRFGSF